MYRKMKKLLLILLTFISLTSFAQMHVKEGSFRQIDGFVMVDKNDHYDDNNHPMALIKISTENISAEERRKITFKGNLETYFDVHFEPSEIYLYISTSATFIEIHHPDYGKTEYWIPEDLKEFCGYEMVVQYASNNLKEQSNYLIIKSDQADARIYIDEEYVGKQFAHKQLVVGTTHTWKIECDLYRTEIGNVTITKDENLIAVTMIPEFGYLNVITSPENGAQVFLNDVMVGETPYRSDKLSIGEYTVKLVKDQFKTTEETIVIKDKEISNINVPMLSVFVEVTLKTDSNSEIYVDGKCKGKGKWNGKLLEGAYTIESRKENHRSAQKTVELIAGNNQTIILESPQPIYGSLEICSNPTGADVYIDGKHYGETPAYIEDIIIGNHCVKLERQDCAPTTKNIVVKENETLTLNENLQTEKEINIITSSIGDEIYIDGNYVGTSPLFLSLAYGTYEFKAIRGNQTIAKTIAIKTTDTNNEVLLEFGKMITISSNKEGDKIYVDGEKVGKTPLKIDFSLGKHEVKVKRGKLNETQNIQINRSGQNSYYFELDNGVKYYKYNKRALTLHAGVSIGCGYGSDTPAFGQDSYLDGSIVPLVKSIGVEYCFLDEYDWGMFVNTMYYIAKNRRPAMSFIVGWSGDYRVGVGLCYAEYAYVPDIFSTLPCNEKRHGVSVGGLFGCNKIYRHSIITCDVAVFCLGNHITLDLRVGIGLVWNKK